MKVLLLFILLVAAAVAPAQDKKSSAEAADLYNKAVKLLDSGKGDTARTMFQKVITDYPNSAYAQLAKESLDKPVVAGVEFRNAAPLSDKELRKYFELRQVPLMVGRPYSPDDAEQARRMMAELMVKKKIKAKDITITTENQPDKKVNVILTVVKADGAPKGK